MSTIRIGTRPSPLALTQTRWVADLLRQLGHQVSLVEVATLGDRSNAAIPDLGAGVFVSALRTALEAGQIDVAVHSLKDLPVADYGPGTLGPARVTAKDGAPELAVAAVPRREDPRDALVSRDGLTLGELPTGATVGTGSARRAAQIGVLGLGLQVVPIRGNVGTRLDLVATGQLDAVIVARAGLARLGLLDRATEFLDPLQMLSAPGQGALAVECRHDSPFVDTLATIDDDDTRTCVIAERTVLAELAAGCSAPIGALAEVVDGDTESELSLRVVVAAPDGSDELRRSVVGPAHDPVGAGRRVAALLREDAGDLLEAVLPPVPQAPQPGPPDRPSAAHGAPASSDPLEATP